MGCSSEFCPSDTVKYDSISELWAIDFITRNLFQEGTGGLMYIPQHRTLFHVNFMHRVLVKETVSSLAVVKYNGNGSLTEFKRLNISARSTNSVPL